MTPTRHTEDWALHVAVTWSPRYMLADLAAVLTSLAAQLQEPPGLAGLRAGRRLLRTRIPPREGGPAIAGFGADAWAELWLTRSDVPDEADDVPAVPRPRVVFSIRLYGVDPARWVSRVLADCVGRIRRGSSVGVDAALPAGDRILLWDPRELRVEAVGDYLGKVGSMIFERPIPGIERSIVTPDTVRTLQREAVRLGVPDVVVACEDALSSDPMGELACLGHRDCWRATEVAYLSLDQLRDLASTALDADDWHALRILCFAAAPDEHSWIPNAAEIAARATALVAWNARAARLRGALGIQPWPTPSASSPPRDEIRA